MHFITCKLCYLVVKVLITVTIIIINNIFVEFELTNLKHCLKIPPLDIFFSASSSPKFSELANIRTSAMLTNLCKKETATSIGIPCVGSITSNSLCQKSMMLIIIFNRSTRLRTTIL